METAVVPNVAAWRRQFRWERWFRGWTRGLILHFLKHPLNREYLQARLAWDEYMEQYAGTEHELVRRDWNQANLKAMLIYVTCIAGLILSITVPTMVAAVIIGRAFF